MVAGAPGPTEFAGSGKMTWQKQREEGWTGGELTWDSATIAGVDLDRVSARWSGGVEAIALSLETSVAARSPLSLHGQILVM